MILRWTIFNTLTAFIIAYVAYFHDGIQYVLAADTTYVTSVITALYVATTLGIIFSAYRCDYIEEFFSTFYAKRIKFFSGTFMGLGIVGTVIGIMQSMAVLKDFNPNNISALIAEFAKAASTAPICTVFGVAAALLLSLQLWYVARENE